MRIVAATAALLALLPVGAALAEGQPGQHPPPAAGKARPAPAHVAPARPAPHVEHRPNILELATKGNGEAQYQVAMATLHSNGKRTKLTEQALVWLGLAASNGITPAAEEGAKLYEQKGDLAEAARWWHRAGELGDQQARTRFIDLYLAGRASILGANGAEWLAGRAATGDVHAKLALGEALETGRGVAADLGQAQRWYLDAALGGDTEAMFRLGRLQIGLPAVWRAPSKEINRDGKWIGPVTYRLRLDGRDHDTGDLDLGRSAVAAANNLDPTDLRFYRPGMVEGEEWLKRAARRGHAGAQYALAKAYLDGIDLPAALPDAIRWLEAAAWQGDARALMTLADLAAKGQGFPGKDPVRAWVCYDLAASLGAKGADAARDRVAKGLPARQVARARQIAQELRELHAD